MSSGERDTTHLLCPGLHWAWVIPQFDADGNLPPGIHKATLEEIEARFGGSAIRKAQRKGLRLALEDLRRAGCSTVYLDGSFVTDKINPRDFDGY